MLLHRAAGHLHAIKAVAAATKRWKRYGLCIHRPDHFVVQHRVLGYMHLIERLF